MDPEIGQSLIQTFGIAGALMLAVKYLATKLSDQSDKLSGQYEKRIEALEEASARCELDRMSLRNQMTTLLLDLLELKKKLT
jgi:hypothetical protein